MHPKSLVAFQKARTALFFNFAIIYSLLLFSNWNIKYLHLFKKLSIFLFFLKAGKSKSYTNASNPSWKEKKKKK